MTEKNCNLYTLKNKDVKKGGSVLADAFQNDPIWKIVLEKYSFELKSEFFEYAIITSLNYGKAYSPSENIEGVAAYLPSESADLSFGKLLKNWGILKTIKIFLKMGKVMKDMMKIFDPLSTDRKNNMKGKSYLYLTIIGVRTDLQGKGYGRKMLEGLIKESESKKIPIYLETAEAENVRMYEKFGFKLIKEITLPIVNLPQWEMIREPESN